MPPNKIFLAYVHGMHTSDPDFYLEFHNELIDILRKDNPNCEYIPLPIDWMKIRSNKLEEAKDDLEYRNSSVKNRLLGLLISGLFLFVFIYNTVFNLEYFSTLDLFWQNIIIFAIFGFIILISLKLKGRSILHNIILFLQNKSYPLVWELLWYSNYIEQNGSARYNAQNISSGRNKISKYIEEIFQDHVYSKEENDRNVIFISHSLGTVITFDFLFNSGHFNPSPPNSKKQSFNLLGLFIAGSPLRLYLTSIDGSGYKSLLFRKNPNTSELVNIWNLIDKTDPISSPIGDILYQMNKNKKIHDVYVKIQGNTRLGLKSHTEFWNSANFKKTDKVKFVSKDEDNIREFSYGDFIAFRIKILSKYGNMNELL